MSEGFVSLRAEIKMHVANWRPRLLALDDSFASTKTNSQGRTIKEIVGHMIDSASNNHQRIVRLQYHRTLDFPDYRQDNERWIAIQHYGQARLDLLVSLWGLYNQHLCHIILHASPTAMDNVWINCDGQRQTLAQLIDGYLYHMNLHLAEIDEILVQHHRPSSPGPRVSAI